MKADLRISVKDYSRNKNLKIQLVRVPFAHSRQFWVKMNGKPWLKDGKPVPITRVPTITNSSCKFGIRLLRKDPNAQSIEKFKKVIFM